MQEQLSLDLVKSLIIEAINVENFNSKAFIRLSKDIKEMRDIRKFFKTCIDKNLVNLLDCKNPNVALWLGLYFYTSSPTNDQLLETYPQIDILSFPARDIGADEIYSADVTVFALILEGGRYDLLDKVLKKSPNPIELANTVFKMNLASGGRPEYGFIGNGFRDDSGYFTISILQTLCKGHIGGNDLKPQEAEQASKSLDWLIDSDKDCQLDFNQSIGWGSVICTLIDTNLPDKDKLVNKVFEKYKNLDFNKLTQDDEIYGGANGYFFLAKNKYWGILRQVLEKDADPDCDAQPDDISTSTCGLAVDAEEWELVDLILKKSEQLNLEPELFRSALENGRFASLRLMLDKAVKPQLNLYVLSPEYNYTFIHLLFKKILEDLFGRFRQPPLFDNSSSLFGCLKTALQKCVGLHPDMFKFEHNNQWQSIQMIHVILLETVLSALSQNDQFKDLKAFDLGTQFFLNDEAVDLLCRVFKNHPSCLKITIQSPHISQAKQEQLSEFCADLSKKNLSYEKSLKALEEYETVLEEIDIFIKEKTAQMFIEKEGFDDKGKKRIHRDIISEKAWTKEEMSELDSKKIKALEKLSTEGLSFAEVAEELGHPYAKILRVKIYHTLIGFYCENKDVKKAMELAVYVDSLLTPNQKVQIYHTLAEVCYNASQETENAEQQKKLLTGSLQCVFKIMPYLVLGSQAYGAVKKLCEYVEAALLKLNKDFPLGAFLSEMFSPFKVIEESSESQLNNENNNNNNNNPNTSAALLGASISKITGKQPRSDEEEGENKKQKLTSPNQNSGLGSKETAKLL